MKKQLLFIAISALAFASEAQISSGITHKYYFNNANANDEVGSANGSVSGATLTTDRFGNPNSAYAFNGSNQYIQFDTANQMMPAVGSVSLWFSKTANSMTGSGFTYNPLFLAKNTRDLYSSYIEGAALYVNTSTNKMITVTTLSGSANEKYTTSTTSVLNNSAWIHLVMTWDNSSLKFYVNGVQEGTTVSKNFTSTFSPTKKVLLGATLDATNNRFFMVKLMM